MSHIPILETDRLKLRQFNLDDAKDVQRLAGDRAIAEVTLNIPHPYGDGMAEGWISTHEKSHAEGKSLNYAIVHKEEKHLIGCISLMISRDDDRAEIGYWIGKAYWGKGYCSEAANELIDYGFKELKLNRIFGRHLKKNPASGRVMEKIGMKYEGCLRQHIKKWDQYEDIVYLGILKDEYYNQIKK